MPQLSQWEAVFTWTTFLQCSFFPYWWLPFLFPPSLLQKFSCCATPLTRLFARWDVAQFTNHLRKPIRSSNLLFYCYCCYTRNSQTVAIWGRLCPNYKKAYITVRMPLEERVLHPHQSWRERTPILTSSCGPRALPSLPVLQICPEMDSPQARLLCPTLLKTCSICFNFRFVSEGEESNLLSLRGDKAIWRQSIFIWSK